MMLSSWWLWWMAIMFLFLVPPVGYGWGYRGWGPPYPRYVQRRRGQQAMANVGPGAVDHQAWGLGGDLIWLGLIAGICGAIAFSHWRG
jgi:hypothetical protein